MKAFFGHSFTDDDKELVAKVAQFLDAQKISHPEFEWVHATRAKPMSVSDKVLPMIRESQIFIGLCTRKERYIFPESVRHSWWWPRVLYAKPENFGWKTSDWIIQEIGVALQLEMELILLVEDGVREPGGLTGDLEYIRFRRDNLAPAFTSLLEMLGGVLSKTSSSLSVSNPPAQTAVSKEIDSEEEVKATVLEEPKGDWDKSAYERAIFRAIFSREKEYEERVSRAFLASDLGRTAESCNGWLATREHWHLLLGEGG